MCCGGAKKCDTMFFMSIPTISTTVFNDSSHIVVQRNNSAIPISQGRDHNRIKKAAQNQVEFCKLFNMCLYLYAGMLF